MLLITVQTPRIPAMMIQKLFKRPLKKPKTVISYISPRVYISVQKLLRFLPRFVLLVMEQEIHI